MGVFFIESVTVTELHNPPRHRLEGYPKDQQRQALARAGSNDSAAPGSQRENSSGQTEVAAREAFANLRPWTRRHSEPDYGKPPSGP